MTHGLRKCSLLFVVDINEDALLPQLMKIENMARELYLETQEIIEQLHQEKKEAEADCQRQ